MKVVPWGPSLRGSWSPGDQVRRFAGRTATRVGLWWPGFARGWSPRDHPREGSWDPRDHPATTAAARSLNRGLIMPNVDHGFQERPRKAAAPPSPHTQLRALCRDGSKRCTRTRTCPSSCPGSESGCPQAVRAVPRSPARRRHAGTISQLLSWLSITSLLHMQLLAVSRPKLLSRTLRTWGGRALGHAKWGLAAHVAK